MIEDAANVPAIINALSRLVPGTIAVKAEGGRWQGRERRNRSRPQVEASN